MGKAVFEKVKNWLNWTLGKLKAFVHQNISL
jgi:hypothetical protein